VKQHSILLLSSLLDLNCTCISNTVVNYTVSMETSTKVIFYSLLLLLYLNFGIGELFGYIVAKQRNYTGRTNLKNY